MNPWIQLALAFVGLGLLFAVLFVLARWLDNFSIVDVAWSYAFGLLAVFYAATGPAWLPRKWAVAALVTVWSARLGTHLLRRVVAHHPREDGRYEVMRERWRDRFAATMFGFFQLQAISVLVLGLPFLLALQNEEPRFHPLEIAGAALWLVALAGESLADAQLRAFKRDPAHRGQVCASGLWRYTRHPNYFFEWLIWMSYALVAWPAAWGWVGVTAPACILYLLVKVTGVPLTEAQALRSKGDAYRRYQETTSAFFPWRPRKIKPLTLQPNLTSP